MVQFPRKDFDMRKCMNCFLGCYAFMHFKCKKLIDQLKTKDKIVNLYASLEALSCCHCIPKLVVVSLLFFKCHDHDSKGPIRIKILPALARISPSLNHPLKSFKN